MSLPFVEIARIADIRTGSTPTQFLRPADGNEGIPFVTPSDFAHKDQIFDTERVVSSPALTSLKGRLVPANSTCVTCIGSTLGKTGFVKNQVMTNQQINSVTAVPGKAQSRYLYYAILNGSAQLKDIAGGSASPILNKSDFGRFLVPDFDLQTQHKIADVLGALDDKIAANQRVMQLGLDFIKVLWQKAQCSSSTEILVGDVIDVNPRTPLPAGVGLPFLDMKNLPEDGHLPSRWEVKEPRSGSKFINGDTLLGRITPCFENGKLGYVDFLKEGEVGLGSTEFIVFRPKEGTPRAVPLCFASSEVFRSEAQLNMVGTSGRQRVTAEFVKQFPVRWPSAEAIHEFGNLTSPLLEKFSALSKEYQTLARTRDELLPLLMNGKITVAEANEEVLAMGVEKHAEGAGDV
ncbi:restriction endonuclease subunit S [Corynebacterium epidermidicanis]|uniref:Restriction endonuclease S subunit n=1 Tax=Corynebacterium epidermidicanis TaxID=1050174 RepID=A0A0G3GT39_9CORY|nr:restriction endonuclease subunit S [Corynebacterium epidermidicanis]AKK04289.1 restriction endonuclease S subunit [Corynebacterium epidermidicanis]